MTQRRRTSKAKAKRRFGRRAFLTGAGVAACGLAGWYLRQKGNAEKTAASGQDTPPAPNPALPAGEWRAVWVSYLEFAEMDFSSEAAFRADAAALMDNCLSLGLNTVIAQVRPFGDALYKSQLFPWSHLCTGVQGQDPGFDPLDILLQEAHGARAFRSEAWLNPYRLRSLQPCRRIWQRTTLPTPPGMGVCSGRRAVSEPGRACSGGLCGAGRGRAFAELRGGRHPL